MGCVVTVLLGQTATSRSRDLVHGFREGSYQIMVATSVAEEGLDIQKCNAVITFDDEQMILKSYIQCKGRARQLHSQYVFFSERRSLENLKKMEALTRQCITALHHENIAPRPPTPLQERYETDIGARITPANAREIYQLYINYFGSCKIN